MINLSGVSLFARVRRQSRLVRLGRLGLLSLLFFGFGTCATGCGEPSSQPADLTTSTLIFTDSRSTEKIVTCVMTGHSVVLIVQPAGTEVGKSPAPQFYAQDNISTELLVACRQLSGYAPNADPPTATIDRLPPGFFRWVFPNAALGSHQAPPETGGFALTHYCQYRFEQVRAELEQKRNEVKFLPNWVYANEPAAVPLGLTK